MNDTSEKEQIQFFKTQMCRKRTINQRIDKAQQPISICPSLDKSSSWNGAQVFFRKNKTKENNNPESTQSSKIR